MICRTLTQRHGMHLLSKGTRLACLTASTVGGTRLQTVVRARNADPDKMQGHEKLRGTHSMLMWCACARESRAGRARQLRQARRGHTTRITPRVPTIARLPTMLSCAPQHGPYIHKGTRVGRFSVVIMTPVRCRAHELPSGHSARCQSAGRAGLVVRSARFHTCRPSSIKRTIVESKLICAAAEVDIVHEASNNGAHVDPADFYGQFEPGTLTVHGGERLGRPRVSDCLTTPICQTSTFTFQNTAELIAYQEGRYGSYEYGRYGNPTTRACEEKIRILEGAEDCLVSASGMNSATTMLLALVPAGGHIVTTTDCYRRTRQFIQTVLPKMGISATVIDPADLAALERALVDRPCSVFFSESPTNPYLRCVDVPTIKALCAPSGCVVCIDSTFATPINQRALALGSDLVLHSGTKYMAGHNDVLAGVLAGRSELVQAIRSMHNVLGGVIDPHAAYLLLRGLKTLDLRVQRHNATALRLAAALEAHPAVARVHYPGLPSHPDHAIAAAQMSGFGGVVSFEVEGDLWATAKLIDSVKLPYIAPSLGGVESLIEQPTVVSYWDQGPEMRAKLGIKDNLVRFSCGIESYDDVWADFKQALAQI
jgi:cystathionine gamma-synthase